MKVKRKEWSQKIPRPVEEVWAYFSRPENLDELTPPDMDFEIRTDIQGKSMYAGMMVQYELRPLPGISVDWVTEITEIEEESYFIDDQRVGPYALWHHQHRFETVAGGTLMSDILHYRVGWGPLGTLLDRWLIDARIEEIFEYRRKKIEALLG